MSFTLEACSRRAFVRGVLGAGLGCAQAAAPWRQVLGAEPSALGAEPPAKPVDADRWTILSDIHVPADTRVERDGFRPTENLGRIVEQLVAARTRAALALVNGDCAMRTGEAGDYAALVRLLAPLTATGVPIHLGLGNHDRRDAFRAGVAAIRRQASALETHEAALIEAPRADLFLLDSLEETNGLPGRLGREQLAWLDGALARTPDKPAIIAMHHPPEFVPLPERYGLLDTWPLLDVIGRRRRVKAVLFGHLHNWTRTEVGGVHYVGLPATAFRFAQDRPLGWVEAFVRDDGMTLELRSLDPRHAEHGERVDFTWRRDTA